MKNYDPIQSSPINRIALHLACALRRPSNWKWHWQGVEREIASGFCLNAAARLAPVLQTASLSGRGSRMRRTSAWSLLIGMTVLLATPVSHAVDVPQYPLMHFTEVQKQQFTTSHRNAPQLAAPRQLQVNFASSVSLLSRLPYVPAERDQGGCGDC